MLGPSILLAPVLDQGAQSRTLYLPAGRWFEYRSGAIHEGPDTFAVGLTLASLPMYVREGAIIARTDPMAYTDEKPIDVLYLDVYPDEAPSAWALYEDEGDGFGHEKGVYSKITYSL